MKPASFNDIRGFEAFGLCTKVFYHSQLILSFLLWILRFCSEMYSLRDIFLMHNPWNHWENYRCSLDGKNGSSSFYTTTALTCLSYQPSIPISYWSRGLKIIHHVQGKHTPTDESIQGSCRAWVNFVGTQQCSYSIVMGFAALTFSFWN